MASPTFPRIAPKFKEFCPLLLFVFSAGYLEKTLRARLRALDLYLLRFPIPLDKGNGSSGNEMIINALTAHFYSRSK